MKSKTAIRITLYLLVYIGVPVIGLNLPNENATVVIGLIYMFLLIPIGILLAMDFYRTNDGTTFLGRIFNVLFRVPLAMFGLVCLITGVAIIGWVLYNVFIQRQKEYTGPRYVIGLGSFGVGLPLVLYGWFTLRSVVRRKETRILSPDEQAAFEAEDEDDEEHISRMTRDSKAHGKDG